MNPRKLGERLLETELLGASVGKKSEKSYDTDVSDLGLSSNHPYSNIEREILENPHAHTPYSDGNSSIYSLTAEAAALGLDYLGFTDHWDPLGISGGNYNEKCLGEPFKDSYLVRRDTLEGFIEDHKKEGKIDEFSVELSIADGAELEFYIGHEDELEEAIEQAEFDYIYLSVHKNKHGEDYRKMEPENSKEAMQIIGSYFRDLREAYRFADKVGSIKVIAHPDGIERSKPLKQFFDDNEEFYNAVLNEEYNSVIEEAEKNDVLSELNGRILLRNGETEWFNVLSNSDVPYAIGTDTHRVGAKDKYDWTNETQARLSALEMKIPELGREPEKVLEDVETSKLAIPRWIPEKIELDKNPRDKIK